MVPVILRSRISCRAVTVASTPKTGIVMQSSVPRFIPQAFRARIAPSAMSSLFEMMSSIVLPSFGLQESRLEVM